MNVLIIDDEQAAINAISSIIRMHFPDISILGSAGTIEEGYEALVNLKPDLVFLDIELPDRTAFDLLKRFMHIPFRIIFVTGHQEYALDAIKVSALDYVLKPVDTDELIRAVEKAYEIVNHEDQQLKFLALKENLQNKKVLKRIILHTSDHLQLISVSDIVRAEADSNYTTFFLSAGKPILVSRTLKEFESLLKGSGIIRIHQSHLVNMNFIDRFIKKDGGYMVLKDGVNVPVSPLLKKQVLQALREHMYE